MVDIKRAFMFPTPWRAQGTCAATYMYPRALRKELNIHSILIHDALSMGQRGPHRAHGLKNPLWPLHLHNCLFFISISVHAQFIYLSWQSCKNPFRIVFLQYKMARVLSGSRTRTLRAPAPISPKPMNLQYDIGFFRSGSRVLVKF